MSVTDAWVDLVRVLGNVAPDTAGSFLPPAPAADVEAAEAATGLLWTAELREFYSLHAGQRPYGSPGDRDGGQLLPYQDLFGVDRVLSERASMIEVWRGITEADPSTLSAVTRVWWQSILGRDQRQAGTSRSTFRSAAKTGTSTSVICGPAPTTGA